MKQILVTGANKGIGLAVVEAILDEEPGFRVILGSRDLQRGLFARDNLLAKESAWSGRVDVLELDVSSDRSVQAALLQFQGMSSGGLYGLVNNAGMGAGELCEVLEVNVHGIRRVCDAFTPSMEAGARVVNVTSASGPNFVTRCDSQRQGFFLDPNTTWEQLEAFMGECLSNEGSGWSALGLDSDSRYGLSKACANSLNMQLARAYPQLIVNACTPGFIETDLGVDFLDGRTPAEAGMKSPADGARVIMSLLFGDPAGTGQYYGSDGGRSPLDRYRAPGSPAHTGS